ncbi:hypothetical protein CMI37_39030 [Candidatus Pacearchaeota archaeon]|jgi:hypothetical protein|nr:hypothetical protein [Candidatus Pacearchaeota archaeon]|tara:strand:- start:2712 stop:2921 length:210 start_codon:yes stop_codon:yes gene_type:complete
MKYSHLTTEEALAIDNIFVVDNEPESAIIVDTKVKKKSKSKKTQKKGVIATVKEVFRPKGSVINDFFGD